MNTYYYRTLNSKISSNKIINDPVYGFISFPFDIHYKLIEHPFFQRLRRIHQLGLTNYVYPGANHTRFQHALGSGYLTWQAVQVIRSKGHEITDHEMESVVSAILLHDIGHGPFSHSLEASIIDDITHEELSLLFMDFLNTIFDGRLNTAIRIFKNEYPKKFLHQLVAGQLDMDRLDYLKRDSFFTGVTEGVIGSDRIIKMLNVKDDELVVDIKGIYSVEKFLVARRLMYWQVYLHKTVLSTENLLINILRRARKLALSGTDLPANPALKFFLKTNLTRKDLLEGNTEKFLNLFSQLDDFDIISAVKNWMENEDKILSILSKNLIDRRLYSIKLQSEPFSPLIISEIKEKVRKHTGLDGSDLEYFLPMGEISNMAYNSNDEKIKILEKNGKLKEITRASDIFDFSALSKTVKKYYICYPKELKIKLNNE